MRSRSYWEDRAGATATHPQGTSQHACFTGTECEAVLATDLAHFTVKDLEVGLATG